MAGAWPAPRSPARLARRGLSLLGIPSVRRFDHRLARSPGLQLRQQELSSESTELASQPEAIHSSARAAVLRSQTSLSYDQQESVVATAYSIIAWPLLPQPDINESKNSTIL